MATVVTTSKQFSLQLNDFWKGLIVAVITPIFTIVIDSLQKGTLTFDWKAIGVTALTALLAYLGKNFLTPAQTVIKGADQPTAPQVAEIKAVVAQPPNPPDTTK